MKSSLDDPIVPGPPRQRPRAALPHWFSGVHDWAGLGVHRGLAEPFEVYELIPGTGSAARTIFQAAEARGLTGFVGRAAAR